MRCRRHVRSGASGDPYSSYSVTKNPYLKRLLGEDAREQAGAELEAPPETAPPVDNAPEPEEGDPATDPSADPAAVTPSTQQLAKLWQSGDHMGVATSLMFTAASYRDFVNLVFIIGQEAGLELGQLLDELADTGNIQPPKTPPQYRDLLKHAIGGEEAGVI